MPLMLPLRILAHLFPKKPALRDSWIASLDCGTHRALITKKYKNLKESVKIIRSDEILLHQLRVGQCRLAGKFRNRIALVGSDLYRWCRREEETIWCHLFSDCKSLAKLRRKYGVLNLTVLCSDRVKGLLFFNLCCNCSRIMTMSKWKNWSEMRSWRTP